MTPTEQLRQLVEAREKATDGPWEWDDTVWDYDPEHQAPWLIGPRNSRGVSDTVIAGEIRCNEENAAFISLAGSTDLSAILERMEKMEAALESISKNTCCGTCQEAALVAMEALK